MKFALPRGDLAAVTLVLAAVAGDLALREMYYRLSSEVPRLLMVLVVWGLIVGLVVLVARRARERATSMSGRLAVFAAMLVWADAVLAPPLTTALGPGIDATVVSPVLSAAVILAGVGSLWASNPHWLLVRRVAVAASMLFVFSQPVVAHLRAPAVNWPERVAASGSVASGAGHVTLFLLLDELNAASARPIVDALAASGRDVRFKAIAPVGEATAQVIPAMFSGQRFAEAKPCGLSTVCSGSSVLDFSKVTASRPDVDVVGFYEPYCAIRGLRSCERVSPASPAFDLERWWCAAMRRSSWLNNAMGLAGTTRCATLVGDVWDGLAAGVEAALWRAPVWREGGFLYAHIPLPHPPGSRGGGSLPEHYRANLERAVTIVAGIVKRLRDTPNVTIVVFSDHPLRERLWCRSTQYSDNGCPLDPSLVDDKVPLIVAGRVPPAFERVTNNSQVFDLAGR